MNVKGAEETAELVRSLGQRSLAIKADVNNPDDVRRIVDETVAKPGSILVAIETSVAWTPLFNMAKAIITDVGGVLSHSAIVGREYGIPVISGCVEGTKKLRTGMKVRVDGDTGVVYILGQ